MGIDRIDKGGGAGGIAPPGVSPASEVSAAETFEVSGVEGSAGIDAASPLARLEAGEINVEGYLDLRVEQATSHLEGKVGTERLDFIRSTLRAQLETDPVLVDLVQRATANAGGKTDRG